jgi:hypothetical protein
MINFFFFIICVILLSLLFNQAKQLTLIEKQMPRLLLKDIKTYRMSSELNNDD